MPGDDATPDPVLEIGVELGELITATRREGARYAAELHPELTAASLAILRRIAKCERIQASRLGVALAMDKSVVSRQVALLRRLGFVEAEPDPDDRRATVLRVSELATERLREVRRRVGEDYHHRFRDWPPEEIAELLRLLRRYNADGAGNAEAPA